MGSRTFVEMSCIKYITTGMQITDNDIYRVLILQEPHSTRSFKMVQRKQTLFFFTSEANVTLFPLSPSLET